MLGLVSLSLFIFENSGVLETNSKHDIEIIHLTLFVVAVVYAGASDSPFSLPKLLLIRLPTQKSPITLFSTVWRGYK